MNDLDTTPRYAPRQVGGLHGVHPVRSYAIYPPGQHPKGCPLTPNVTAVKLVTDAPRPRWYGVEDAFIGSSLRLVVFGFPSAFEEMARWEKADRADVKIARARARAREASPGAVSIGKCYLSSDDRGVHVFDGRDRRLAGPFPSTASASSWIAENGGTWDAPLDDSPGPDEFETTLSSYVVKERP